MLTKRLAAHVMGRWSQLLGGLIAALLLLPVPALALTFSGSWQAVIQRTGKPLPPRPTFADVTNNSGQHDELTVDLANYQGVKGRATSSIELTRHFSIADTRQQVRFGDQFISQFAKAGVKMLVTVKDAQGHMVVHRVLSFHDKIGSASLTTVQEELDRIITLKKGNYVLDVKVMYQANGKGGAWQTISPHQFDFIGL